MPWDQVLTLTLGIFFGLSAFASVLALVIIFIDRQEAKRKERKEFDDLRATIRNLETENSRLRRQVQPQQEGEDVYRLAQEDEDYAMIGQAQEPVAEEARALVVTVDVREAVPERSESEEPRPTRYDRIEDNEPAV